MARRWPTAFCYKPVTLWPRPHTPEAVVRDAHILLHVYTVADRHCEGNTRHASPTCDGIVAYIELKLDDNGLEAIQMHPHKMWPLPGLRSVIRSLMHFKAPAFIGRQPRGGVHGIISFMYPLDSTFSGLM